MPWWFCYCGPNSKYFSCAQVFFNWTELLQKIVKGLIWYCKGSQSPYLHLRLKDDHSRSPRTMIFAITVLLLWSLSTRSSYFCLPSPSSSQRFTGSLIRSAKTKSILRAREQIICHKVKPPLTRTNNELSIMVKIDQHEYLTEEEKRLEENYRTRSKYWLKWGPYVAERQWATGMSPSSTNEHPFPLYIVSSRCCRGWQSLSQCVRTTVLVCPTRISNTLILFPSQNFLPLWLSPTWQLSIRYHSSVL